MKAHDEFQTEVNDLCRASCLGHQDTVAEFIDKYPLCLDRESSSGDTALMWAVFYEQKEITELLLDNGAGINVLSTTDWTPLMWAVRSGSIDMIELLLDRGAAIDAKNTHGNTALMMAASRGNTDVVKFLIGKNALLDGINKDGNTALTLAKDGAHFKTAAFIGKQIELRSEKISREFTEANLEKLRSRKPFKSPLKRNRPPNL